MLDTAVVYSWSWTEPPSAYLIGPIIFKHLGKAFNMLKAGLIWTGEITMVSEAYIGQS